jgi:hypothetical protein
MRMALGVIVNTVVLVFACLVVVTCLCLRAGHHARRTVTQSSPQSSCVPHSAGRSLAEAAFAYERAVIDLLEIGDATKVRALRLLADKIVPLVGVLDIDDLPEIHVGVRYILETEAAEDRDRAVIVLWDDFVRWSRYHLGPHSRGRLSR